MLVGVRVAYRTFPFHCDTSESSMAVIIPYYTCIITGVASACVIKALLVVWIIGSGV